MPRFTILPIDRSPSMKVFAADAAVTLGIVDRLKCGEADIHRDDLYSFTARRGEHGLWTIFQREAGEADHETA